MKIKLKWANCFQRFDARPLVTISSPEVTRFAIPDLFARCAVARLSYKKFASVLQAATSYEIECDKF